METWILATLAAACFQTLRFTLQKRLNMTTLSAAGATYARFLYAAPFLALGTGLWLGLSEASAPHLPARFWGHAATGGLAQILATLCIVLLFQTRAFAVGITFKKTEVLLTVAVSVMVLGEGVSSVGLVAIVIGFLGVVLLSADPEAVGRGLRRLDRRAVGLGLSSGLLFAISGVSYRGASLAVPLDAPLGRAAVTLTAVVLMQTLAMTMWLRAREPGQIARVLAAARSAVWIGVTSLLGSLGWFTAYTLQNAAYVNALGQVELILSIAVSALVFRERIAARELLGIGVLGISIAVLLAGL